MSEPSGTNAATQHDRHQRVLILVLLALSVGTVLDLVFDQPESLLSLHVLFEVTLAVIGLGAVLFFWRRLRASNAVLAQTRQQVAARSAERDQWRRRAETILRGLGVEIDHQFKAWALSPTESETALMLLKGLELKQIAALQGKSERTVRQHAIAVYRKSGLSGRAELAAYFLEDLLLPSEMAPKTAT
jgi:DNA-binding NarL/FixJ family response regulator